MCGYDAYIGWRYDNTQSRGRIMQNNAHKGTPDVAVTFNSPEYRWKGSFPCLCGVQRGIGGTGLQWDNTKGTGRMNSEGVINQ